MGNDCKYDGERRQVTEIPEGTHLCAYEYGTCKLGKGGGRVYYGREKASIGRKYFYHYKDYSSATNVPCNNDEFCDPVTGQKKCYR